MDEEARQRNEQRETRLQKKYGTVPKRGQLLHHQLENRTYFDSGDLALFQAHKSSSMGSVTTGTQHPIRETISRPFCPVAEGLLRRRSSSESKEGDDKGEETRCKSHLAGEGSDER
ncbi:hypothetical protein J3F83DRAFT_721400 [Trichoderma novae-zelandiae]